MRVLLDSHIFLWAIWDHQALPAETMALLAAEDNQLLVSAASIWELTIKAGNGKSLPWRAETPIAELDKSIDRLGATRLPITSAHAVATYGLRQWEHKDPFDRMLAAQAHVEDVMLITSDSAFRECPLALKIHWSKPVR